MFSTFEDRVTFFVLHLVITVATLPVAWVLLMAVSNGAIHGGFVVMASNMFAMLFLLACDWSACKRVRGYQS